MPTEYSRNIEHIEIVMSSERKRSLDKNTPTSLDQKLIRNVESAIPKRRCDTDIA